MTSSRKSKPTFKASNLDKAVELSHRKSTLVGKIGFVRRCDSFFLNGNAPGSPFGHNLSVLNEPIVVNTVAPRMRNLAAEIRDALIVYLGEQIDDINHELRELGIDIHE